MRVYLNQFNTATDRNLLPLATGLLRAYAMAQPDLGPRVDIKIVMDREAPERTARRYEDPDVLGFSCYTWNYRQSCAVAQMAKELHPDVINVFGGPSVPRRPDLLAGFFRRNPYVDVAVIGEGELSFADVLRARVEGRGWRGIPGTAYRPQGDASTGAMIMNPERPRLTDPSILPSPFLDGTFDQLLEEKGAMITGALWETNRGCPFACTFCDWGQAIQSRVHVYDEERLLRELDWISEHQIYYVFAADGNFGIKRRDLKIAQHIAQLHKRNGFPGYFFVNWLKNSHEKVLEIADTLGRADVTSPVTLSMQSFSEAALEAIRRDNIRLSTFRKLKEEYSRRHLPTYCELILGLPGETYDSFCDGVVSAMSAHPRDTFNVYNCYVYENAEMGEPEYRRRHGIETRVCRGSAPRRRELYLGLPEEIEVIVGTSTMTTEEWRSAHLFANTLAGLYNLRLAHVVINYLRFSMGISPRAYIEFLIDQTRSRHGGLWWTVTHLRDYTRSILAGETENLFVPGYGDVYFMPHESCFAIACADSASFYQALGDLTRDFVFDALGQDAHREAAVANEAVRFQAQLAPVHANRESRVSTFEHDWPGFCETLVDERRCDPTPRTTVVRFGPPPTMREDQRDFVSTHLSTSTNIGGMCCEVIVLGQPEPVGR